MCCCMDLTISIRVHSDVNFSIIRILFVVGLTVVKVVCLAIGNIEFKGDKSCVIIMWGIAFGICGHSGSDSLAFHLANAAQTVSVEQSNPSYPFFFITLSLALSLFLSL